MRKFYTATEGVWVFVRRSGQGMACCDCGLVHKFQFRNMGKHIQIRGWRDERRTAALRREMKKRGEGI